MPGAAQFTELQQKEQLAKLASAREALAAAASGTRKFKFVSGVNDQARRVGAGWPASAPFTYVCIGPVRAVASEPVYRLNRSARGDPPLLVCCAKMQRTEGAVARAKVLQCCSSPTSVPHLHALALQGFIEGRYVPLEAGEDVTASMDVVEAGSAEEAAAVAAGAKA